MSLRVLTPLARLLWTAIFLITVAVEVIPIPPMPPVPFYAYCAGKIVLFVLLGYLIPLAFWRFNSLNRGILLALVSAMSVEVLQGVIGRGHSFQWYELVVKVAAVLIGFALAIDARYDRRISIGPIHIRLTGEHLSQE